MSINPSRLISSIRRVFEGVAAGRFFTELFGMSSLLRFFEVLNNGSGRAAAAGVHTTLGLPNTISVLLERDATASP